MELILILQSNNPYKIIMIIFMMRFRNLFVSGLLALTCCNTIGENEVRSLRINNTDYADSACYFDYDIERVKEISREDYRTVVRELKTPLEAAIYCTQVLVHGGSGIDKKLFNEEDYWASFKYINKNKVDDCDGGAVAAASILEDDGFPSTVLEIISLRDQKRHAVFLYKNEEGKFGSIGINREDIKPPIYNSVYELGKQICRGFNYNDEILCNIYDLKEKHEDFIENDEDNSPLK